MRCRESAMSTARPRPRPAEIPRTKLTPLPTFPKYIYSGQRQLQVPMYQGRQGHEPITVCQSKHRVSARLIYILLNTPCKFNRHRSSSYAPLLCACGGGLQLCYCSALSTHCSKTMINTSCYRCRASRYKRDVQLSAQ